MTNPHLTDPDRAEEVARLTAARDALVSALGETITSATVEGLGGNTLGVTVLLTNGVEVTIGGLADLETGYAVGAYPGDENGRTVDSLADLIAYVTMCTRVCADGN